MRLAVLTGLPVIRAASPRAIWGTAQEWVPEPFAGPTTWFRRIYPAFQNAGHCLIREPYHCVPIAVLALSWGLDVYCAGLFVT